MLAGTPSDPTINHVLRKILLSTVVGVTATAAIAATLYTFNISGVASDFDYPALEKKVVYCSDLEVSPERAASEEGIPPEMNAYFIRLDCSYQAIPEPSSLEQARLLLDSLAAAGQQSRTARSACHDLAHDVGTKAWRSLGVQALKAGMDSCGYGYYHGVMRESVLGEADPRNGMDRLRALCDEQIAEYDPTDNRRMITWSLCAHGVGHALGGAGIEIPLGIELCQPIRTALDPAGDITCVSGLFNELSQGGWGFSITTTSEALKRCESLDDRYKQVCSSYSNFYSNVPLDILLEECNTLAPMYVSGCWEAVGLVSTHEVLFTGGDSQGARLMDKPSDLALYLEDLCAADRGDACFGRFLNELSELALDPPKLLEMCAALRDSARSQTCSQRISAMESFHTI
jgi:hypothetical protein